MRVALGLAVLLLLAGCGEPRSTARVGGDPGGVPVTVSVTYDREALAALAQGAGFTRTVVIEREPWPDPFWPQHRYHRHHLHGYGYRGWAGPDYAYEPATSLSLLVGDGPAEAQLLRARLAPGTSSWTLPMRPGREAVVSLQADGGREGWREIGRFTAATGARVTVHLAGAQPRVEVSPATGSSPTASAEASTGPTGATAATPAGAAPADDSVRPQPTDAGARPAATEGTAAQAAPAADAPASATGLAPAP